MVVDSFTSAFMYCPKCGQAHARASGVVCTTCSALLRGCGADAPWAKVAVPIDMSWPWRIDNAMYSDDYVQPRLDLSDDGILSSMRAQFAAFDGLPSMEGLYRIYRERDGLSPAEAYEKLLREMLAGYERGRAT